MSVYESLITLDPLTFVATICNLLIQMYLFKRFLLDKVRAVIAERKAAADGEIAAAKAARAERVNAAAAKREVSRERMIGNLLRGQARAAEFTKGSQAKRDAYARCLMTATAAQYGLTLEQAANLADLPVFEPMTWAEYRARYAKTTDVADVA